MSLSNELISVPFPIPFAAVHKEAIIDELIITNYFQINIYSEIMNVRELTEAKRTT